MPFLTRCPFCAGSLRPWWRQPPFSKCRVCHLVIRNPFPDPETLADLYAASWADPDAHQAETGNLDLALATQYVRELLKSLDRQDGKGLRLLDFGAGRGSLMSALEQTGAEVWGIEPYGYDHLRALGKTVCRTLEALPPGLAFDGIVSFDVIEHLVRPWQTIADLAPRLAPGGWICLSAPNPRGLNARLMGSRWREARKPGHLMFMEERTLEMMLRQVDLPEAQPVRWQIRYDNGLLRHHLQRLLAGLGLAGTVRVIAAR